MRRMTTLLLTTILSAAVLAGCGGAAPAANGGTSTPSTQTEAPQDPQSKVYQIGLTQIVEHPSLDTVRQGIIEGLKEAGFEDGKQIKIEFQSAQGEMPIAQQIAQKFVADKKDLIIAIATPSAQAVAQATKEIPIIFGTVTDPVGAGLVKSFEKPETNVTGTSDMTPVKEQLSLFAKLGADVQKVGMIYNAGEANSVTTVAMAKEAADELGLTIVEATVANPGEVQQAAQSLVGRVDGLYLITDNTLAQGVQSVIALANQHKLPTVSVEQSYVDQGALATYGFDYLELGRQTGKQAAQVLKGADPAELPVQVSKELTLVINTKTAEAIGLEIPAEVLKAAQQVAK